MNIKYVKKLAENTTTHKDWLTLVEYGRHYLTHNIDVLSVIIGDEIDKEVRRNQITTGNALKIIMEETQLKFISD